MNQSTARLFFLLAFLLAIAVPKFAYAVPPASPTTTQAAVPSNDDLKNLLHSLQDPAQRQALIGKLNSLIALRKIETQAGTRAAAPPSAAPQNLSDMLISALSHEARSVAQAISAATHANLIAQAGQSAQHMLLDPQTRWHLLESVATVLGVLALAVLAERAADWLLSLPFRRIETLPRPFWIRLATLAAQVLLRWIAVAVFLVVGYAALASALAIDESLLTARALTLAIIQAHALARSITVVFQVLFLALRGGSGFGRMGEETAAYWRIWCSRLSRFVIYSYALVGFVERVGIGEGGDMVLIKTLGMVFVGLLVMLTLQNRTPVSHLIRGSDTQGPAGIRRLRRSLAEIWHIALILYILGIYGVWASDLAGGFAFLMRATLLTLLVVVLARVGAGAGTRLAQRMLDIGEPLNQRLPHLQARVNLYAPALMTAGRGLLYGVATLLVLQIWGLNALLWLASETGRKLLGALAVTALTAVVAILTWETVGIAIQLYFSQPGEDGMPIERSARMRTLLPLFRKTLAILLSIAVCLVVLSEIGINIGPLLAGAGIAGIAIGFGAQTLVKDVITGLFILMQDAISVGDVVAVAGNSGLVEQISIRSLRLRDLSGTVIIIPFSEVSTIQNMTKEFAYALFNVGISYREDVDEVIEVLTALGDEMREDAQFGALILDRIEILGLDQFADSAIIIKARIKTRPIQQWTVMREYNRRLKRRFDELNIEMPFPHRTIYFGVDKKGAAPPAFVVAEQRGGGPEPAPGEA